MLQYLHMKPHMSNLRQKLYAWRNNEATRRGIEYFRVIPNTALDAIARVRPKTKEELIAIKGIKEAKWREYGQAILRLVSSSDVDNMVDGNLLNEENTSAVSPNTAPLTVSAYLDIVNQQLSRISARIRGEVVQFKFQGNALYATIKDTVGDSALSVFMWRSDLTLAGCALAEGMEVIIEGYSEVYKPTGRFVFRAQTIEPVGEGALKKAYEALYKKLDAEGLFASARKRPIPEYPERIGLITSKTGAVINDFLTNLGRRGYEIKFVDSRVEGAAAVRDILSAIKHMKTENVDVLVIIRGGGGSLELLQTFNNEHVVRAIATFPRPVLCAIGHDKDVPLAQLAADLAPSTPSLCAIAIDGSWNEATHLVHHFRKDIVSLYSEQLRMKSDELRYFSDKMREAFKQFTEIIMEYKRQFTDALLRIRMLLSSHGERLRTDQHVLISKLAISLQTARREASEITRIIELHNPLRQLRLGYSILLIGKRIARSVNELPRGTTFEARLSDGTINATRN